MDEGDDGARVGLWVTLGVVTLLLFGLIGGLAFRQAHKAHAAAPAAKPAAMAVADADALVDAPLTGELLGKVYFDTGVAAVPADAAAAITAVVAKIGGTGKLVLAGFHDATGDAATNAVLAKDRAKAVRAALTAAGVDASRVVLRKPESTTGDGKPEEARRVDIRVLP